MVLGCHTCLVKQYVRDHSAIRPQGSCLENEDEISLSCHQLMNPLKETLKGLDLSSQEFCSHTFSVGMATEVLWWS